MTKYRTREQTETAQEQAVRFANDVLGDSDLSDELASLRPEEYASRKGIIILANPLERRMNVPNGNGSTMTKSDLQDICDQVESILADAYQPESDRATLVDAVANALSVLAGDAGNDDDGDSDDDDSDLD